MSDNASFRGLQEAAAKREAVKAYGENGPGSPRDEEVLWLNGVERYKKALAERDEAVAFLRKLSESRLAEGDGGRVPTGCSWCDHDPEWPENHPTHKPGCELAAFLARVTSSG